MIPGFVISIPTFPGVIIHEAAHLLFCRIFKLAVFEVCFFRVGNPAGYVIHERTDSFAAAFFVSIGPFMVNSLLCVLFCTTAFLPVWELNVSDPLAFFFYWLVFNVLQTWQQYHIIHGRQPPPAASAVPAGPAPAPTPPRARPRSRRRRRR